MLNVRQFLLLLVTFTIVSCKTPAEYFNRPVIHPTIMNGDGTGYKNGELIEDTTNMIGITPEEYDIMLEYYDDKEFRLMVCLKYPKRCS